ncbi:glycosyltransferase [Pedobacter sp. LMG 31464]|uniref:Glycosyltransferase n=1 Tax=Pedobacter planticolens TaxID=2679964 RepID=A0A923DZD1_9SPHI|nr:glycosyltransferase family 4 protein [Pedobacter planticolens]MBB2145900.1 glycosyltransferase [Pedobacter planticolens]
MNVKKKLLIVTPYMPYPLNSGGNISQFEMNDSLRKNYHLIIVFPLRTAEDLINFVVLKSKWEDVTFYPFYAKRFSKIIKALKQVPSVLSRLYNKLESTGKEINETDRFVISSTSLFRSRRIEFDKAFVGHVKKVITEIDKINAIQVEFFDFLPLIKYLPKNIPSIFVHHELRFIREKRELEIIQIDLPLLSRLQRKNEEFEFFWLKQYDQVLTVSIDDCKLLADRIFPARVTASPLSIKYQNATPVTYKFDNKLIFLGGSEHFPNREGVNWFIGTCWEVLKAKHKDLSLLIIGKWGAQDVKQYENFDGVKFMGFVDDLFSVMANSIFIVPIRIGSGIRMKIIEAVNHGLPFVTTTVGVEGLSFKKDEDCLIGDTSLAFASRITEIIENPSLAQELIAHARETLVQGFSYENSIELRKNIYESIF